MKKQLIIVIAFTLILLTPLFTPLQINAKNKATLDVNTQDEFGATLLMQAVIDGNIENAKWLLKSGANPNIKDKAGVTAMHFAAKKGNIIIVKLLLKHGAKVNTKDIYSFTPRMRAISHGNKKIADVLNTNTKTKPFNIVPIMKPKPPNISPIDEKK